MYQPRRFGYATYRTPTWCARSVITPKSAATPSVQTSELPVLASRFGEEAVVFERGSVSACIGIAFQIDPGVDIDAAGHALDLRNP